MNVYLKTKSPFFCSYIRVVAIFFLTSLQMFYLKMHILNRLPLHSKYSVCLCVYTLQITVIPTSSTDAQKDFKTVASVMLQFKEILVDN